MGETTNIAWTDHTFNPWLGCTRVSEGCRHCYAEQLVEGRMGLKRWGNSPRTRTKEPWKHVDKWNTWSMGRVAKGLPRSRVFCASLADVFEDAPGLDAIRSELWDVIDRCKALDWQLLTKRPQNIMRMLPPGWLDKPRPHVWLGTTVEDQKAADERIPYLLHVPAAVHFLSCEPLLGPVTLREVQLPDKTCEIDALAGMAGVFRPLSQPCTKIDWVIVGGESGPGARACEVEWIRDIARQCFETNVACFVKQLGAVPVLTSGRGETAFDKWQDERAQGLAWPEGTMFGNRTGDKAYNGRQVLLADRKGGDPEAWPRSLRVQEFPR